MKFLFKVKIGTKMHHSIDGYHSDYKVAAANALQAGTKVMREWTHPKGAFVLAIELIEEIDG